MKILYVTTIGATMGFFKSFIKSLIDEGHTVDIATNESTSKVPECYREWDLEIYHIDTARSPLNSGNIRAIKQLKNIVECGKYDIVHCHTPIAAAITRLVCMKARKTGTTVMYTAHGFHFYDGAPLKNWILFYPVEKIMSYYTDVLITINKEDYKRATEKFHAKKTVYIPGVGVDVEKFAMCKVDTKAKRVELGVKDDDFLILSVGELSGRKNQKIVIDALKKMKEDGSIGNIVYLAAGEGDMREPFEHLIKENGLGDHIKLLGFRADIDELCETVDCFVHPSVREGLGLAALEAMAAGLPLISADVNGIKDYTEDGISGCCVDPLDVNAMATAIKRMRDDEEFRTQCAANNLETVKTFDIRNSNEIMEKIYRGGYEHLRILLERQQKRTEIGVPIDATLLISVGELNKNKNHEVVIRAIADLDVYYVIVGKGHLKDYLQDIIDKQGLTNRVKLLDFRSDIPEINGAADIFVFPSIREGLGLAAIEGMAAGLPLIVSKNRGSDEYARDGVNAYVCPSNDIKAFETAICRLKSSEERYRFGRINLDVVKEFSLKNTNEKIQRIYDELT